MLRNPTAPFRAGRGPDLLKVKQWLDVDAVVVGFEAGKGRHKGRIGALQCELLSDRTKKFKVGTGLKDKDRALELFESAYRGAVVEVKYQELTNAGVPRFPVFLRVKADHGV